MWSRSSRTLVFVILVLVLILTTPIASLRNYSQSSSSSRLRRPCLCLRPLCLHLLPTTPPQLPLPSLLPQSQRPSLAPSFTRLAQLPVSSLVFTPPPLPCPFEHPLYHCTTDDPTHPLLLLSPRSALSLRVGWPAEYFLGLHVLHNQKAEHLWITLDVRTCSDTTPANSNPVLTRYVSPSFSFPLIFVPTSYVPPLFPLQTMLLS